MLAQTLLRQVREPNPIPCDGFPIQSRIKGGQSVFSVRLPGGNHPSGYEFIESRDISDCQQAIDEWYENNF